MTKAEKELLAVLIKIRDSTFRDAASLRGMADLIIQQYIAGDFKEMND